jgi:hypothetical protein
VHLKALVAAFFAAVCGPLSYILELGVNAWVSKVRSYIKCSASVHILLQKMLLSMLLERAPLLRRIRICITPMGFYVAAVWTLEDAKYVATKLVAAWNVVRCVQALKIKPGTLWSPSPPFKVSTPISHHTHLAMLPMHRRQWHRLCACICCFEGARAKRMDLVSTFNI